jgi:hypothetical protein
VDRRGYPLQFGARLPAVPSGPGWCVLVTAGPEPAIMGVPVPLPPHCLHDASGAGWAVGGPGMNRVNGQPQGKRRQNTHPYLPWRRRFSWKGTCSVWWVAWSLSNALDYWHCFCIIWREPEGEVFYLIFFLICFIVVCYCSVLPFINSSTSSFLYLCPSFFKV